METKLSPWCKAVKITLIEKDMSINELADAVGMRREYVSSIINGRAFSKPAVRKISDFLDIPDCTQTTVSV